VGVGHPASGESPQQTLRILSEQEVPIESGPAFSIRFASDETVFLTLGHHGLAEVTLDGKLTVRRKPIPDRETLGVAFRNFDHLAVSPDYLAVSSLTADLGFRPRATSEAGTYKFTKLRVWSVYAMDLRGDRLLLLGDPTPRALEHQHASRGEIAWIGPLSDHPQRDMKPFLYDVAGPPPPSRSIGWSLANCMLLGLGAARFLPDGSYLVVPGFQEGAFLYSPDGTLRHTWKNDDVGLDAPDCASLSARQEEQFASSYRARFDFLNQHRVLEEILPLAQGPGLLIRSVSGGALRQ